MRAWRKKLMVVQVGEDAKGNPMVVTGRKAKNLVQQLLKVNTQPPKLTQALLKRAGVPV